MDIGRLRALITADDRDYREKMRRADQLGAATAAKIKSSFSNLSLGGGKGFLSDLTSIAGGNLVSGAIQTALGGVTSALQSGLSAGINYNKMLELAGVSFTTLLGSTARAQAHLEELRKFGESTPFEFPDLIKGSQRMQAMGFAADAVIPTLRAVGDAVSAVGGGKEELDGVVLALGQMKSKGTVSAEEMNQLAERGIPAWDILAQKIGKTTEETRKLGESGRLRGAPAVDALLEGFRERFGGQMDKMSATLAGRESNFQDILNRQLGAATAGSFEELKKGYEKATIGLSTTGAQVFATELDKLLTEQARAAQAILDKFASGEYFRQGAAVVGAVGSGNAAAAKGNAITGGAKAAEELRQGNFLDALIGKPGERGPKIEAGGLADQGLNWLKKKFESLGSEAAKSFGVGMATGAAGAQAAGAAVGGAAEEGVRDSLQQRSPSRVMLALGAEAAISFGVGFENGKKRIQVGLADLAAKFGNEAQKIAAAMEAALGKVGAEKLLKKGVAFGPGFFTSGRADIDAQIQAQAARQSLPPELLFAQLLRESRFNPNARSPVGAEGIAQFMPGTAKRFSLKNPLDPIDSIRAQADYMGALFEKFQKFGNVEELALAGYNAGENRKSLAAGRVPAIAETRGYIKEIEAVAGVIREAAPSFAQIAAAAPAARDTVLRLGELAAPVQALAQAPASGGASGAVIQGGGASIETIAQRFDPVPVEKLAAAFDRLDMSTRFAQAAMAPLPPAMDAVTAKTRDWASEIVTTTNKFGTASERLASFQDRIGQNFDDLIGALVEGGDRWKNVAKNIAVDFFNGLASEMMLAATGGKHGSIGSLLGGLFGGLVGGFFGFGGKKAGGGPVAGGQAYLVGEQGPELFVPGAHGRVIPAHQTAAMAGGGRINNITINVPVSAPAGTVSAATRQQIAAQTAQSLQFALARNG